MAEIVFEIGRSSQGCDGHIYTNKLNRAKDRFLALKPDDIAGPHPWYMICHFKALKHNNYFQFVGECVVFD